MENIPTSQVRRLKGIPKSKLNCQEQCIKMAKSNNNQISEMAEKGL